MHEEHIYCIMIHKSKCAFIHSGNMLEISGALSYRHSRGLFNIHARCMHCTHPSILELLADIYRLLVQIKTMPTSFWLEYFAGHFSCVKRCFGNWSFNGHALYQLSLSHMLNAHLILIQILACAYRRLNCAFGRNPWWCIRK